MVHNRDVSGNVDIKLYDNNTPLIPQGFKIDRKGIMTSSFFSVTNKKSASDPTSKLGLVDWEGNGSYNLASRILVL